MVTRHHEFTYSEPHAQRLLFTPLSKGLGAGHSVVRIDSGLAMNTGRFSVPCI